MNLLVLFLLCFILESASFQPSTIFMKPGLLSDITFLLLALKKKNLKIPQESHQDLHSNHWEKIWKTEIWLYQKVHVNF